MEGKRENGPNNPNIHGASLLSSCCLDVRDVGRPLAARGRDRSLLSNTFSCLLRRRIICVLRAHFQDTCYLGTLGVRCNDIR